MAQAAKKQETKSAKEEKLEVRWLDEAEDHNYPAAMSYLSLNAKPKAVRAALEKLRAAGVERFEAKDILRASGMELLPQDDENVVKQFERIRAGEPLSPCLIVRGNLGRGYRAQIADGYHRICASFYIDPSVQIPVHIADF